MTTERKTCLTPCRGAVCGGVLSAILLVGCMLACASTASAWTAVGPGIEYQEFTLPDPNNVFVARMERRNPAVTIESSIGQGRLSGGTETVRSQASRYEDAIGYWGYDWGRRNDVIVAINGDFWNTSTGVPLGGQIHSGWVAKTFSGASFGWSMNRNPFIQNAPTLLPRVRYMASGSTQYCNGLNRSRGTNELVLYTPQYDSTTKTDNTGVEVLVEMTRPTLVLPDTGPAVGRVRQIRSNLGSTPIPFDHVVLSATGTAATTLLSRVSIGAEVGISCQSGYSEPWMRTYAGVGAGEWFLMSGVVVGGQEVLHPRTAIAYNTDHVFFVVVDGRSSVSIGMTMTQLGNFCKDYLGATFGINQDGGGSSTMVVNGVVKNDPSDGRERAVANGMMMVAIQPKIQSTTFGVNDLIKVTTANTNLRLGPGTHFSSLISLAKDAQGTVLDHSLRGIFAKGYSWWKCDFAGTTGWVAENNLALVSSGGYPTFMQHPSEQNPCLGDTVNFSVSADGTGPLAYQWQKDGVNLADSERVSGVSTPTLTISNVGMSDMGSFRCIVTDSVGSASSYSAALFPPRALTTVLQHPEPLDAPPVPHGLNATFVVAASGDGAITYQWQHDGVDLSEDSRHLGVTSPTLTITQVNAAYDDGAYRCRVTAGCGTVYSNDARLNIVKPDFDEDGDVDARDFGHLQVCMTGLAVPVQDPDCMDARLDADSDVDQADVAKFMNCLSAQDQPYDVTCLD
ncbi:MAG: phosphodiester glycosidase family protein [Phycisphaerae bacterium]|nr:phosphodiester glycosidase family protein [Phycisphaerae bacterium]